MPVRLGMLGITLVKPLISMLVQLVLIKLVLLGMLQLGIMMLVMLVLMPLEMTLEMLGMLELLGKALLLVIWN